MSARARTSSLSVKLFVSINAIMVAVTAVGLTLDVIRQYRAFHNLIYEQLLADAGRWRIAWVESRQRLADRPARSTDGSQFVMFVGFDGAAAPRPLAVLPANLATSLRQAMLDHAAAARFVGRVAGHEVMIISLAIQAPDAGGAAAAGPGAGQRVVVADYIDKLAGNLRREIVSRIAFAVITVLWVLVMINLLLARWVARPVARLSAAAARLGRSDYDQPIGTDWGTRELNELAASFEQAREHLHLAELARRADLARARRTQLALLPALNRRASGLVTAGFYQPAYDVGGDLYDLQVSASGRMLAVVGDASGHGVAAALMMAMVKTDLAHLVRGGGPADLRDLAGELNGELGAMGEPMDFVSLLALDIDPAAATARFVNGGHPPGLLQRAGGPTILLEATGPLVGALPDSEWDEVVVDLHPGDRIVLYTDGLTDVENAAGEPWGSDRLDELAARCRDLPPEACVEAFKSALAQWRRSPGDRPAEDDQRLAADDITLMVLDYTGAPT